MQDFFHQLVKAFLFFLDSGNWKLLEGYHLWMTLGMPRRTGRVEPRCVVFFWVEMMLTLFSTKKHGFNKFYGSTRGHDKLYKIHTSTNSVKIPIILGPNCGKGRFLVLKGESWNERNRNRGHIGPPVLINYHSWLENGGPLNDVWNLLDMGIFQPAMLVYQRVHLWVWYISGGLGFLPVESWPFQVATCTRIPWIGLKNSRSTDESWLINMNHDSCLIGPLLTSLFF